MTKKKQLASSSRPYAIGKGRPPLSTRWQPGQSGNPRGRPKGAKTPMTYLLEDLSKKLPITENGITRKAAKGEVIARNLTNHALKGDLKATLAIFAKEPEIAAALKRVIIPKITRDMTPIEAAEAYRRLLHEDYQEE